MLLWAVVPLPRRIEDFPSLLLTVVCTLTHPSMSTESDSVFGRYEVDKGKGCAPREAIRDGPRLEARMRNGGCRMIR